MIHAKEGPEMLSGPSLWMLFILLLNLFPQCLLHCGIFYHVLHLLHALCGWLRPSVDKNPGGDQDHHKHHDRYGGVYFFPHVLLLVSPFVNRPMMSVESTEEMQMNVLEIIYAYLRTLRIERSTAGQRDWRPKWRRSLLCTWHGRRQKSRSNWPEHWDWPGNPAHCGLLHGR